MVLVLFQILPTSLIEGDVYLLYLVLIVEVGLMSEACGGRGCAASYVVLGRFHKLLHDDSIASHHFLASIPNHVTIGPLSTLEFVRESSRRGKSTCHLVGRWVFSLQGALQALDVSIL